MIRYVTRGAEMPKDAKPGDHPRLHPEYQGADCNLNCFHSPLVRERSRVQSPPTAPKFPYISKALSRRGQIFRPGTQHEPASRHAIKRHTTREAVHRAFPRPAGGVPFSCLPTGDQPAGRTAKNRPEVSPRPVLVGIQRAI